VHVVGAAMRHREAAVYLDRLGVHDADVR